MDGIKKVLDVLVRYNEVTNQEMIKILEGLEPGKLTEDLGSYYGSILGLLNHQLLADVAWLRALGTHLPTLDFVPPVVEPFPKDRLPPKELYVASLEEFKPIRRDIDALLKRVVETLLEAELDTTLKIEGRHGVHEFKPWRILLHLFNHQTHHRGGVSLLLDQLGIENDYSNMLWKV